MEKKWSELKKGDWIVCPKDGVTETVSFSREYVSGRQVVRTSRHDHYRPASETVTLV